MPNLVSYCNKKRPNLIPSPSVSFMYIWQQRQWMPVQSNHSPLERSWMWLAEEREEGMWHVESAPSPSVWTHSVQIDKFTHKTNKSYTGNIPQIISAALTGMSWHKTRRFPHTYSWKGKYFLNCSDYPTQPHEYWENWVKHHWYVAPSLPHTKRDLSPW